MIHHTTELRKGQVPSVVDDRRKRLQKLITVQAPELVIISAAESYLRSYKWSWRGFFNRAWMGWAPDWLLWLTSRDYREVSRQTDEERDELENEMREMFGPRAEGADGI